MNKIQKAIAGIVAGATLLGATGCATLENKAASDEEAYFPGQKALTCSAQDYFASTGKNPKDYELIGVFDCNDNRVQFRESEIPEGAEVVVDVNTVVYRTNRGCVYGTALVPRTKVNEK